MKSNPIPKATLMRRVYRRRRQAGQCQRCGGPKPCTPCAAYHREYMRDYMRARRSQQKPTPKTKRP